MSSTRKGRPSPPRWSSVTLESRNVRAADRSGECEAGIDESDLADEAGFRVRGRAYLQPTRHDDLATGADHWRDLLHEDDDDVDWPVGIRLAERADRQRLAREHEEVAFRLQRRRHVAGQAYLLSAQGRDAVRKLEAEHAEGFVEAVEGDRGRLRRSDIPAKQGHRETREGHAAGGQHLMALPLHRSSLSADGRPTRCLTYLPPSASASAMTRKT